MLFIGNVIFYRSTIKSTVFLSSKRKEFESYTNCQLEGRSYLLLRWTSPR